MIYKTSSEEETIKAAAAFAATLKPRDIILLNGDLGMGKSVFSRAVIRTITHNPDLDVPSPTFTLAQTYNTPMGDVWHFDLYRLKDPEELYEIGWEDALSSGIILVEWPERLNYLTPKKSITVTLTQGETPTSRVITVER
ncbi:MAG: tRNA (adenosine(37)-N6)-threonylcarbamoyltransferase complex ATPase subunit type 1 TsaE [Alphaproteobacteria bacterium RIFCSPHIGHO2_12_FULL_45_9]|nr:MAG: tRNA (adenosine(37)-N6)-threonylcarbamoyltransferase complex ATPase subunit type 1 TsaE [Alphaproteobacteria bacterium RIFCSPHIGHO2_02_FULL_46_13]OFW99818.1 MAG: tRNA (adenosine(37)-N6)-threonylcarbamoyltransferase complex ATPase subunit type 1 TsaE [Alphaproteobacteria bacterium RIFCSPHIGHO2_12_FULL_45_9]